MKIRKLTKADAQIYQSIRLKALKENPEYYSSSYEEESQRNLSMIESRLNQEFIYTWGAFIDDSLVGIITLSMETREKTKHIVDIFGMYVDSKYRNQGIGKALMKHVIDDARSKAHLRKLRLSVTDSNQKAIHLYESFGFKIYGLEHDAILYNNTYYHSLMMEIIL